MTSLMISNALLWVLMLAVIVALWALARQVGILYERIAPMGALVTDAGPKLGDKAPAFELPALNGALVSIGGEHPKSQLLFFVSTTCPVCKKLLPVLKSASQAEREWLDVVLASDGDSIEHLGFYQEAKLQQFPYVLSADLGMTYRVSRLPVCRIDRRARGDPRQGAGELPRASGEPVQRQGAGREHGAGLHPRPHGRTARRDRLNPQTSRIRN